MTRPAPASRRVAFGVAGLAAMVLGWSQPMPAAEAGFTGAASASAAVTAHTLATPVLDCDPGGLLVGTVTLNWPQVSSAATADPYGPSGSFLADGYEIHKSTGVDGFTLLTSPGRTATTYSENPGGSNTYRYKIRTKKAGWYSPFSNVVTAEKTSLVLGISTTCNN